MKILSGFLFLICAAAVFAQSDVAVKQSDDVTKLGESKDSKQDGSITLNAVHVGDESMSEEEAFKVLRKADIISSVDVGTEGTLSENSFAMASVIYKFPKSDALEFFRKLFAESETLEGRTYALMGLKFLKENYYYKNLGMTIDSTALVSVYANGKLYEIKMSKFLNAFERRPSVFVPSSFPSGLDKELNFDEDNTTSNTATETRTIVKETSYVYTDFGTVLYPLPSPVVIVTRPCKRPPIVHIRPLPPRPVRPVLPRPLPPKPVFPRPVRPGTPSPRPQPGVRPENRPQRPPQSRPQIQKPRPPQSKPQMRPVSRPRPSANFNSGGRSSANMQFRR